MQINTCSKNMYRGFCLAAPRSGEGKTTLAMGLMRAFRRRGLGVQAFKCGPDYIDPTFHAEATGRAAYNVDTWMMGVQGVQSLWDYAMGGATQDGYNDFNSVFLENTNKNYNKVPMPKAHIGICEGVMGLFDGREVGNLEGSTAHVAKVLGLPVILVFSARGMAASATALARGFYEQAKEEGICIAGFIANNVGSARHVDILRTAFAQSSLPPLLGAVPREKLWTLPERQLGLVPRAEVAEQEKKLAHDAWYDAMAEKLEKTCDIDALWELSHVEARPSFALASPASPITPIPPLLPQKKLRIAIAKDTAFCFYYVENERFLQSMGHELIPFSPMQDAHLPQAVDAVYLGGGYPEVFVKELAANESMRASIKAFAENGGEVYAECGGYMYLCTHLVHDGQKWPMCNVLHATATMGQGIKSLGYRQVTLLQEPPFGLAKSLYRGHEFHWSDIEHHEDYAPLYRVEIKNTVQNMGASYKNVKAGYVHMYWGGGSYEA